MTSDSRWSSSHPVARRRDRPADDGAPAGGPRPCSRLRGCRGPLPGGPLGENDDDRRTRGERGSSSSRWRRRSSTGRRASSWPSAEEPCSTPARSPHWRSPGAPITRSVMRRGRRLRSCPTPCWLWTSSPCRRRAGTSSETNSVGILTTDRGHRLIVGHALRPRHAIIDPCNLTSLTPSRGGRERWRRLPSGGRLDERAEKRQEGTATPSPSAERSSTRRPGDPDSAAEGSASRD